MVTTDMIFWFKSKMGSIYYLGNGFIPIRVTENTTLAEIEEKAKRYSSKSIKRMFNLIYKKYFNEIDFVTASSLSLHIKKYNTFERLGIKYVIF
jgi:hypothetical protein